MEILGLQLYPDKESIYAKVNPLKKEIKIVKSAKKPKIVASIPVKQTTFRIFNFSFNESQKIKKAIETALSIEFSDFNLIDYSYIKKDDKIFCIITKKEYIKKLKEEIPDITTLDSDIFSIIRVMNFNRLYSGEVLHFYDNYAFYLKVEESFPLEIRTLTIDEAIKLKNENTLLSGNIPETLEGKKLKNPVNNPQLNVAFGNVLKPVYQVGVDFLHKEISLTFNYTFVVSLLSVLLFLFINTGFLVKEFQLKKELKLLKNKEKEIYIKYFGDNVVVDPISQAKGKVANLDISTSKKEDVADFIDFIGNVRKKIPNLKIVSLTASTKKVSIKGYANSIEEVDKFKTYLKKKLPYVKIEESSKDASGKIRFKIKASTS